MGFEPLINDLPAYPLDELLYRRDPQCPGSLQGRCQDGVGEHLFSRPSAQCVCGSASIGGPEHSLHDMAVGTSHSLYAPKWLGQDGIGNLHAIPQAGYVKTHRELSAPPRPQPRRRRDDAAPALARSLGAPHPPRAKRAERPQKAVCERDPVISF